MPSLHSAAGGSRRCRRSVAAALTLLALSAVASTTAQGIGAGVTPVTAATPATVAAPATEPAPVAAATATPGTVATTGGASLEEILAECD